MSKKVLISTGGSGGHVFPAVALADEILKNGWDVDFTTDERGKIFLKNLNPKIKLIQICVRNNSTNYLKKIIFFYFLVLSILEAIIILFKSKPDIVVGFGGYPSFPILLGAYLLKKKCIIHEQNVILGKVNNFFSKKVSLVLFGLKPKEFNKNDFKYKYIGTPVREDIIRLSGLKNTGKKNDIFTIFVLGGSQGAKVLTNSFLSSLSFFPKDKLNKIFIYIQCREEEKNKVKKILKNFHIKFTVSTFFDDIGVVINNSDLIISRAGASTLSELIILGRPSILVPMKFASNDHQFKNALNLAKDGGARIILEKNLSDYNLYKEIENLFYNPKLLSEMSTELQKLSKPDAANEFFNIIKNKVI